MPSRLSKASGSTWSQLAWPTSNTRTTSHFGSTDGLKLMAFPPFIKIPLALDGHI
jgi:hypothetical protein